MLCGSNDQEIKITERIKKLKKSRKRIPFILLLLLLFLSDLSGTANITVVTLKHKHYVRWVEDHNGLLEDLS